MDKRTVLALLVIAVIFIMLPYYWEWMGMSPTQTPVSEPVDSVAVERAEQGLSDSSTPERATTGTQGESGAGFTEGGLTPAVPGPSLDSLPEELTRIETDLYEATISSHGAAIASFRLKNYNYFHGEQIDLVPERDDYPLQFSFPEVEGLSSSRLAFRTESSDVDLTSSSRDSVTLRFTADTPEGVPVVVAYTFRRGSYAVGMVVDAARQGELARVTRLNVEWKGGLDPTEEKRSDDYGYFKAYVRQAGEVATFDDFDSGQLTEGSTGAIGWVATKSKYFLVALRRADAMAEEFEVAAREFKTVEKAEEVAKRVFDIELGSRLDAQSRPEFEIYLGPVDYGILSEVGHDLKQTVEMGFWLFRPFAVSILWFVTTLHSIIPNYGWVIILFTIVMKIIFFPFSRKNYKQMARMKSLQPKLKAIQEKFKDDPQRLNQQMMKLYKEEKFNPLGGCIWMLPQLPIFWALFTVFKAAIELRGAGFLWLEDLSQASMLLAVIMAGAMLVQQLLTNKDPKQKFMVYGFPVIMFFLFKGFPAGLVLYWTVYNLLSIVEQKSVERTMALESGPVTAEVIETAPPPPAGRKKKKKK